MLDSHMDFPDSGNCDDIFHRTYLQNFPCGHFDGTLEMERYEVGSSPGPRAAKIFPTIREKEKRL